MSIQLWQKSTVGRKVGKVLSPFWNKDSFWNGIKWRTGKVIS